MYGVRLGRRAITVALASTLLLLPLSPAPADPGQLPAHVTALYKISFSVLGDIGFFRFKSDVTGDDYHLYADAKIDTSVFDYHGIMSSTGTVPSAATTPDSYSFQYNQKVALGKKKKKAINILFNPQGASRVRFDPPDEPSKGSIPVTQAQLRGVLDPLSGVMALSIGDTAHPCERRLPIFDGKQRFDLIFTPARRPTAPTADQVCHVKLIPISGHKPGHGSDSVIKGTIEVTLRPVPRANIVIPYRVTVPTIIGAAVLTSEQVDITMPDRQRIALRR